MIIRKVKDFRTYCKSDCKVNCFASGCYHAGTGSCERFEKLVDFQHEQKRELTNEKTTQETSKKNGRKTGQEKEKDNRKKGIHEHGRRALQV